MSKTQENGIDRDALIGYTNTLYGRAREAIDLKGAAVTPENAERLQSILLEVHDYSEHLAVAARAHVACRQLSRELLSRIDAYAEVFGTPGAGRDDENFFDVENVSLGNPEIDRLVEVEDPYGIPF